MLKLEYTVLCEFARLEAGGKFTLIGVFPNGIGTPMIPFPLPALTFFQVMRADSVGQYKINARLSQLDNGHVLATAQGVIQVGQPGTVVAPLTFANLKFTAFGVYTFSVDIEGQPDPFMTEFSIAHIPNAARFMPGFPGS
jgi:hypothetical protein